LALGERCELSGELRDPGVRLGELRPCPRLGPRPPLLNEVAEYTEYDLQRLAVKPGITGWWQVTERNSTGFDGMVRRDLEYIANRGIFTDLKIVVLTVIEVITGKGAY